MYELIEEAKGGWNICAYRSNWLTTGSVEIRAQFDR